MYVFGWASADCSSVPEHAEQGEDAGSRRRPGDGGAVREGGGRARRGTSKADRRPALLLPCLSCISVDGGGNGKPVHRNSVPSLSLTLQKTSLLDITLLGVFPARALSTPPVLSTATVMLRSPRGCGLKKATARGAEQVVADRRLSPLGLRHSMLGVKFGCVLSATACREIQPRVEKRQSHGRRFPSELCSSSWVFPEGAAGHAGPAGARGQPRRTAGGG